MLILNLKSKVRCVTWINVCQWWLVKKITKIAELSDSPSKAVIFKSGDEFIIVDIIALMIYD